MLVLIANSKPVTLNGVAAANEYYLYIGGTYCWNCR